MNVLGRYEILEQLGTGSMGTVYRARDTRLEREIAIKTIRTSGEVEPEIRERFFREARACARLQHEGIVQVYDVGEENKIAFIAMELLHGEDLRKTIEKRREIPLPQKLNFMIQVCEAIHHAHSRGVIHRDLKPSNLFLSTEGRAKVMDFGIARLPSSRLTVAGNILGTPNYMAPEQMLGKPTDARTDLFSAALVFFELLVYVHPFHASVIPKRIVEGDPDSLFDHDPSLPVLLEKVLNRALSKDPEKRYASGAEFATDLRAVLDAVKLNASPTMSKVQLPSDRALPKSQSATQGDMTLLKPAPEGEDPAEWRLSEVLRLIPEFEDAQEAKNQGAAREALEHLQAIATADKRFTEAADSCRVAYEKTWGKLEPPKPPATAFPARDPDSQPTEPIPASVVAAVAAAAPPALPNRPVPPLANEAASAAGNSTTPPLLTQTTSPITGPKTQPLSSTSRPITSSLPSGHGTKAPVAAAKKPASDKTRFALSAIVVIICLAVLVWAISFFMRPVVMRDQMATARVGSKNAVVHKTADDGGETVIEVPPGEALNVLQLPKERTDKWVWVQPVVEGKTYNPGYVKIADLNDWTDWSYKDGNGPAQLARVMTPENGSEEELKTYVAKLRNFSDRVAGVGADQAVQQQIGAIEKILAARNPVLPTGETGVPSAQGGPANPTADAGSASAPAAEEPIDVLMRRAQAALKNLQLDRAQSIVNQVLKREPNNAAALELASQIKQVREIDAATR